MNEWNAFILGAIQGIAEFLPISSSGHIALFNTLIGGGGEENLAFTVMLHVATVLSTLVVFRKEIGEMLYALLHLEWNEKTKYLVKIALSMIPIGIVGVFFKDNVEALFGESLATMAWGWMITSILLACAYWFQQKQETEISFLKALYIGIAQAFAVFPGLSRSGTTISTGILLGCKKEEVVKFSFLMVIVPILGEALLDVWKGDFLSSSSTIPLSAMLTGFFTAFVVGVVCCKMMIEVLKRGKLIYFSLYCLAVGVFALTYSLYK